MYKSVNPLFLISQTPLHAGSGDSLGIVDMPIQRERHTSFPKIEGSSFKGALRENMEQRILKTELQEELKTKIRNLNKAFGYDDGALKNFSKKDIENLFPKKENREFAGALSFTDARLFLFPIKSMKGVFAWITCPKVLQQFQEDMKLYDSSFSLNFNNLTIEEGNALVAEESKVVISNTENLILEEYAFTSKKHDVVTELGKWLSQTIFKEANEFITSKIKKDIVVLDDDAFKDFVNLSTEVITRTKINNETGTVQNGALFTEEYLPSESVMYSLVLAADEFAKENPMQESQIITFFEDNLDKIIQIGGNATIGKGLTKTYFMKGGTKND
jgi:CRISPR-associated protein Cmr4